MSITALVVLTFFNIIPRNEIINSKQSQVCDSIVNSYINKYKRKYKYRIMGKKLVPGVLSPEEENFVESIVNTIGYACLVKPMKQYYPSLIALRKHTLFQSLWQRIDGRVQFVQDQTENTLLKDIFTLIAEVGLYAKKKAFKELKTKVIIPDIIQHKVYPNLFESVTGLTIMGYRLKVEEEKEE